MIIPWQQKAWLRRTAFIAGNLAAGAVLVFAAIRPVSDYLAERDRQIAEQRTTLARFRAVAGQEAAVQSAAGRIAADRGEFLAGKSEGVISADLQTGLKRMAEAAGAKLRSVRGLPARDNEQSKYVGTRVELFGSLAAIHRAIHSIESAKPFLFITGAAIRPSPPIGQTGPAQEPIIEAQLDVFAAVRIEATEK